RHRHEPRRGDRAVPDGPSGPLRALIGRPPVERGHRDRRPRYRTRDGHRAIVHEPRRYRGACGPGSRGDAMSRLPFDEENTPPAPRAPAPTSTPADRPGPGPGRSAPPSRTPGLSARPVPQLSVPPAAASRRALTVTELSARLRG